MELVLWPKGGKVEASLAGIVWFTGWLSTMAYANAAWWKISLGIVSWVVWPCFRGFVLR